MRIFVTAGNTQTPIDRVRCITNIFTGRTGAGIALEAYRRGHHVTLATSHPEGIAHPVDERWRCDPYRTFDDLDGLMVKYIADEPPDAVVHGAAVSDYCTAGIFAPSKRTFFKESTRSWHNTEQVSPTLEDRAAGKVKSDAPELWLRLVRAPKLVDKIRRDWGYAGILIKFKLEVGVTESELLVVAERSRQDSRADWMVANTLEGSVDWAFIGNERGYQKVTRAELPGALLDVMEGAPPRG